MIILCLALKMYPDFNRYNTNKYLSWNYREKLFPIEWTCPRNNLQTYILKVGKYEKICHNMDEIGYFLLFLF